MERKLWNTIRAKTGGIFGEIIELSHSVTKSMKNAKKPETGETKKLQRKADTLPDSPYNKVKLNISRMGNLANSFLLTG